MTYVPKCLREGALSYEQLFERATGLSHDEFKKLRSDDPDAYARLRQQFGEQRAEAAAVWDKMTPAQRNSVLRKLWDRTS